jgi:AraC-like DNA-binding protein
VDTFFYFLERIFIMTAIPIRCYNADGVEIFRRGYSFEQDPFRSPNQALRERLDISPLPILEYEEDLFVYGALKDDAGNLVVFGPITTAKLSNDKVRLFTKNRGIKEDGFYIVSKTLIELSSALAMVFFHLTGKVAIEHEIIANSANTAVRTVDISDYVKYIVENSDVDIGRLTYSDELRYVHNVINGTPENISDMAYKYIPDRAGNIANSPLKKMEYMICTSITLISRAAIREGLDSMLAYTISDLYLQRLEQCRTEGDMYKVNSEMQRAYAELIKKAKEIRSKSTHVERCKVYIANNLTKPFTLDDIADEVGINKSYLSRKFTEEMKMGIKHYTMLKRIEAAANVLKFSDIDIIRISEALCFSSQSHFGKVFKQFMGVTPQSYRNKEGLIDVSNKN